MHSVRFNVGNSRETEFGIKEALFPKPSAPWCSWVKFGDRLINGKPAVSSRLATQSLGDERLKRQPLSGVKGHLDKACPYHVLSIAAAALSRTWAMMYCHGHLTNENGAQETQTILIYGKCDRIRYKSLVLITATTSWKYSTEFQKYNHVCGTRKCILRIKDSFKKYFKSNS